MVDIDRLAGFAFVAMIVIAIPGPSVLFVVSRGVAWGGGAAVMTASGNEAGMVVQVVAVALGLGAIVERSVVAFTVLKLMGACYLVFLGLQAIRHRADLSLALGSTVTPRSPLTTLREGFVVGLTNPQMMALFTAILPQFVVWPQGDVSLQLLVRGLVAVAIALLSDSTSGIIPGTARSWLVRSPPRLPILVGPPGILTLRPPLTPPSLGPNSHQPN